MFVFPPSTRFQTVLSDEKGLQTLSVSLEICRLALLLSLTPGHLYQWAIQKNRSIVHCTQTWKNTLERNIYADIHWHTELYCGVSLLGGVNNGKREKSEQNDSKTLTHHSPPVKVLTKTHSHCCDKQDEILIKVTRQLGLLPFSYIFIAYRKVISLCIKIVSKTSSSTKGVKVSTRKYAEFCYMNTINLIIPYHNLYPSSLNKLCLKGLFWPLKFNVLHYSMHMSALLCVMYLLCSVL